MPKRPKRRLTALEIREFRDIRLQLLAPRLLENAFHALEKAQNKRPCYQESEKLPGGHEILISVQPSGPGEIVFRLQSDDPADTDRLVASLAHYLGSAARRTDVGIARQYFWPRQAWLGVATKLNLV